MCEICGEPQQVTGICKKCVSSRPPYYALRSWAVFKPPIQHALHKLKYRHDVALGDALAPHLAEFVENLEWEADLVVSIPLSQQRLSERGYNQVAVIAQPLALINQWHYTPQALRRIKHTRSQVGLSVHERQRNVQGAFIAEPRTVKGKKVLLMDDVATTGATLVAASQALMDAGAEQVYALTVAKALSRYGSDAVLNTPFRSLR